MAQTVIRTPELSTARILKPFKDFEKKYQGLQVNSNPIMLPGTLDPLAGSPGYDQNLLAGIPVPVGADMLFYFPRIINPYQDASLVPNYVYTCIWRMRSQAEAVGDASQQLAGNLGQRLPGVEEKSGTNPGPRFVIPAAVDTVSFTIDEPANASGAGTKNIRTLERQVFGGEWIAPLSPNFPTGGTLSDRPNNVGIVSQGLYDNTVISGDGTFPALEAGFRGGPNYNSVMLKAKGNELIVLVTREAVVGPPDTRTWDFGGADASFSEFFGTANGSRAPVPNTGIQIYTGSFSGGVQD